MEASKEKHFYKTMLVLRSTKKENGDLKFSITSSLMKYLIFFFFSFLSNYKIGRVTIESKWVVCVATFVI